MDLVASIATPANIVITVLSVLGAFFLIQASKRAQSVSLKVFLIYAHIALLLVPVAAASYSTGCAMMPCTTQTLLFAMPFLLAGVIVSAGIVGYVVLPRLYRKRFALSTHPKLQHFISRHAKRFNLNPTLHIIDSATPMAFSFRSWNPAIFISVGMMDLLTPKETEAVLFHELGHLVHRSSWVTFATKLMQAVSPVAFFAKLSAVHDEERFADAFAADVQKTARHVRSARSKL